MKKKMMFYFIFLSLMACKKESITDCAEPTNELEKSRQLIVGKWEWTFTNYYSRKTSEIIIMTPKSENLERKMEFKANDKLSVYENGSSILEIKYEFKKPDDPLYFPDLSRYHISWKGYGALYGVCSEYLYLDDTTGRHEVWQRL
jgi:hypothetical protein